jgi:thiamine biosynthesis lipoprotein
MGCEIVVDGDDDGRVDELFAARDARFSRFRADSELSRVNGAESDPVLVSEEFARMLATALAAARSTGGLVTPAVGAAVVAGHAPVPSWRRLRSAGRVLFRAGIELDLNGVVKGATVDDALALLPGGGSVGAGGDIATTRPVVVEVPGGETITLRAGGLATSGTDKHERHLIDPKTGRPSTSPWRLVTVAAGSCLAADVAAKAAFLLGPAGPSWLDRRGLPGRFVDRRGRVTRNQSWASALWRAAA